MTQTTAILCTALVFTFFGCDGGTTGIGDPCLPDSVPCDSDAKNCGFRTSETYIERQPHCETNVCVVHRLDNGTQDAVPADPTVPCGEDPEPGCATQAQVDDAVYCSCRCDGPSGCACPDGFVCQQLFGAGDLAGSYCVRP